MNTGNILSFIPTRQNKLCINIMCLSHLPCDSRHKIQKYMCVCVSGTENCAYVSMRSPYFSCFILSVIVELERHNVEVDLHFCVHKKSTYNLLS